MLLQPKQYRELYSEWGASMSTTHKKAVVALQYDNGKKTSLTLNTWMRSTRKYCVLLSWASHIFVTPNFSVQSQRNGAFPFIHTLNIFEAHTGNLHRNMQMRSKGAVLPTVGFVYSGELLPMSTNNRHTLRAGQAQSAKLHNNPPTTPPPPFAIEGFFDRQKHKPNFEYFINTRGFIVCKMSYAKGGVA